MPLDPVFAPDFYVRQRKSGYWYDHVNMLQSAKILSTKYVELTSNHYGATLLYIYRIDETVAAGSGSYPTPSWSRTYTDQDVINSATTSSIAGLSAYYEPLTKFAATDLPFKTYTTLSTALVKAVGFQYCRFKCPVKIKAASFAPHKSNVIYDNYGVSLASGCKNNTNAFTIRNATPVPATTRINLWDTESMIINATVNNTYGSHVGVHSLATSNTGVKYYYSCITGKDAIENIDTHFDYAGSPQVNPNWEFLRDFQSAYSADIVQMEDGASVNAYGMLFYAIDETEYLLTLGGYHTSGFAINMSDEVNYEMAFAERNNWTDTYIISNGKDQALWSHGLIA